MGLILNIECVNIGSWLLLECLEVIINLFCIVLGVVWFVRLYASGLGFFGGVLLYLF